MQRLIRQTDAEKRCALSRAIRDKCQFNLTSERLDYILSHLNLNRLYYIKATRDREKFLNIVTEECVVACDRRTLSYTFKLYGDFQPGYFCKSACGVVSCPGSFRFGRDAAAVKLTATCHTGCPVTVTYTLALYGTGVSTCSPLG